MKKKIGYMIYGAVGVLLCGAMVFTSSFGLSRVNQEAYDKFLTESDVLEKLAFDGFAAKNYKVRFFDGEQDFVMQKDAEMKKDKETLDVIAATAVEVDDEYQVLVPVYEKMQGVTQLVDGVSSLQNADAQPKELESFSQEMYVAAICHEAFHCWQFTKFEEQIENGIGDEGQDREAVITSEIDANDQYVKSIEHEMECLQNAYNETALNQKYAFIKDALAEEAKRQDSVSDAACRVEKFVETLEGSAQYVEAMAYRDMTSEASFEKHYLADFKYTDGSGKYYTMGLMKCLILDQVSENWQSDFSYENNASKMLEKVVK
ncbi:MAG: hypothetical protein Q4D51_03360 [Eubacteriales bacterium]|nr:hypothetical protein [Eubacteriales bacterium]